MEKKTSNREMDLRVRLLEHLLDRGMPIDGFIAFEPQYAMTKRRADILVVSDVLHAYEIKSEDDSLARLKDQLADYKRTFDFVTIVTSTKHLSGVLSVCGQNEGVLLSENGALINVRDAKQNKKIAKRNLIHMCSKATLAQRTGHSVRSTSISEIRAQAERVLTLDELKRSVGEELSRRFKAQYLVFVEESGRPIEEYDLALFRRYDRLDHLMN